MRRRKRNIEIFSLSAIDLFASAMGAFIIFSAILIPYYPNMKDGGKTVERLQAEIEASLESVDKDEAAKKKSEEEKRRIAEERERLAEAAKKAAERAKVIEEARAKLVAQTKAVEQQNAAAAETIYQLETKLDDLKKRNKAHRKATPNRDTDFSILGITTKKKSIVIVVDLSGSMKFSAHIVTRTLNDIIAPFHDEISFAILGYQGFGVTRTFPPVRGVMARGDARSKRGARTFINILPLVFNGSTPTRTAVLQALNYRAEAIILLSDGEPTDSTISAALQSITAANRGRAEIHTVAVGDYLKHTDLIQFLNNLAKQNNGKFVGVIR